MLTRNREGFAEFLAEAVKAKAEGYSNYKEPIVAYKKNEDGTEMVYEKAVLISRWGIETLQDLNRMIVWYPGRRAEKFENVDVYVTTGFEMLKKLKAHHDSLQDWIHEKKGWEYDRSGSYGPRPRLAKSDMEYSFTKESANAILKANSPKLALMVATLDQNQKVSLFRNAYVVDGQVVFDGRSVDQMTGYGLKIQYGRGVPIEKTKYKTEDFIKFTDPKTIEHLTHAYRS